MFNVATRFSIVIARRAAWKLWNVLMLPLILSFMCNDVWIEQHSFRGEQHEFRGQVALRSSLDFQRKTRNLSRRVKDKTSAYDFSRWSAHGFLDKFSVYWTIDIGDKIQIVKYNHCWCCSVVVMEIAIVMHHCLNQCWQIVYWTFGNIFRWNFNRNSNFFIDEKASENAICKMVWLRNAATMIAWYHVV